MVFDLHSVLYPAIVVFAFLTTVIGVIMLNALFGNKIKELFSDTKYFIFFFLIAGYFLYALGELTWYLIFTVFEETSLGGMPDFYWVTGTLLMLLAFLALSKTLYQEHEKYKLFSLLFGGALLLILVISIITIAGASGFLSYFYPIISSLIVASSATLLLFFEKLDLFESKLVYLFFSNVGFLLAEVIYTYLTPREIYGLLGAFADILYLLSYILSAWAFLTLLMAVHSHASKK